MWKSFVLELREEWSEPVDECIGLNAPTERSLPEVRNRSKFPLDIPYIE
ncbi:hypothetical protein HDF09_004060 [Edaphobacter lichenicola]|uniref:Uncharacterized protein n=1 Tax=Tunturiibacter empetritectus TaxID=3069691 RepID=A0A7W8ILJ7_9BACT|nr:hypothetical protein [Edaphobacter lichenicola]